MSSEAHWDFITYKYSLVDSMDGLIVISRFNQNELLRDLIYIRLKILEVKYPEDLMPILDDLLLIQSQIIDERLKKAIKDIIEQFSIVKIKTLDRRDEQKMPETEVAD